MFWWRKTILLWVNGLFRYEWLSTGSFLEWVTIFFSLWTTACGCWLLVLDKIVFHVVISFYIEFYQFLVTQSSWFSVIYLIYAILSLQSHDFRFVSLEFWYFHMYRHVWLCLFMHIRYVFSTLLFKFCSTVISTPKLLLLRLWLFWA